MDAQVTVGMTALHYRPSTGRIIRTVKVIEIKGEAAWVRSLNGKDKGKEYPVEITALVPAFEGEGQ